LKEVKEPIGSIKGGAVAEKEKAKEGAGREGVMVEESRFKVTLRSSFSR